MSDTTPEQPDTPRVHPQEPAEGRDDDPETAQAEGDVPRVHPQDPAEGPDDSSATS